MPGYGFIHGDLDVKMLILYIARRLPASVPSDVLLDLTLCDDGVDYFQYITCRDNLVNTGHLCVDSDGLYSITAKGAETISAIESSLAYSVRMKVERNVVPYVRKLERDALVKTSIDERGDGSCTVSLSLSDGSENVLDMALYSASREQAELISKNFSKNAEKIFSRLLEAVTEEY